jgi:hypothetical protein
LLGTSRIELKEHALRSSPFSEDDSSSPYLASIAPSGTNA